MSIVRFLAAEKDTNRIREDYFSACYMVVVSGIFFSVLFFLLSDFLAISIFKDTASAFYIKLSSILILLNSIHPVLIAFFRMRKNIGLYTILELSFNALQTGIIVILILLGYKLAGVIIGTIIVGVVSNIIALVIILKQIGFQRPRFSNMKSYLKWGIPLTPNSAIMWIIHSSDRYMLSYSLGVAATGVYSVANGISNYASLFLMPLGIVLYPTISKAYDEENQDECKNYLKYSFKYLMMIAIPSAVGLSVLANPLLQILTTPEFSSGSAVVPFLASGAVFYCIYQMCIYVIHMVGKTHITVRLLGGAAVLNIFLNMILIPRMGMVGAALATLIAYTVLAGLTIAITRSYMKMDFSIPFIIKSIISSAIMAVSIWLINPETITMLIFSILVGIVIYFGVLIFIRGFSRQELAFFAGLINEHAKGIFKFKKRGESSYHS
jgi:O-antigen/teichoic acid export membrane protein